MRRRSPSPSPIPAARAAVPFAAAACLLAGTMAVAGCGASAAQPNAALPGADGAPGATATASATSTVKAQIPADYNVDIEISQTGDPNQDALLARTRDMLMAYEQAVSRNAPDDSLYRGLITSFALANLHSMINTFAQANERPTGSVRFYRFSVRFTGKIADVFFCQDTSKVVPVDFKTGQKTGAAATGTAAFSYWDTAFQKNSGGAWSIVYVSSLVGRESCMS